MRVALLADVHANREALDACLGLHLRDGSSERLFFIDLEQRGIRRTGEGTLVLLLLDGQNVGRALGAGQQVFAVVTVEELAERFNAAHDHQQIVLTFKSKHRVNQIVPRTLIAQLNLQAIREEGEQIGFYLAKRL